MNRRTEVLTFGETMVMVAPAVPGPIRTGADYRLRPGGAESNVALHLARLGHSAQWGGRVGNDPFGKLIVDYLADAGVIVDGVEVDNEAPTGVYFKEADGGRTSVFYYRTGSAASRMSALSIPAYAAIQPKILHLSGITPALSDSCLELVRQLVEQRPVAAECLSFDVNFRPALWPAETAAPELLRLACASDVVFVGLDEAAELWGVTTPDDIRDLVAGPRVIVVKNDSGTATSYQNEVTSHAAPERVPVVEAVGAGDAFAAGWLGGLLRGYPPEERLKLGHTVAAHVLSTTFDDAELPESLGAKDKAVEASSYF